MDTTNTPNGELTPEEKENTSTTKTVYLIRHAESEENRRLGCLTTALSDMTRFRIPKGKDLSEGMTWVTRASEQVDSPVSEVGQRQIQNMGDILKKTDFVKERKIQLVAHSPLQRARQTSHGLLGCSVSKRSSSTDADNSTSPVITKAESVERVVELDLLLEKQVSEYVVNAKRFKKRIEEVEAWLEKQPEQVIALVGHSQHFKAMLSLPFKFGNCDVWQVDFDGKRTTKDFADQLPLKWTNLQKVHSGALPIPTESTSGETEGSVAPGCF